MTIYQSDIDSCIDKAKKDPNAAVVLVVCDMFDWSDYIVVIHKDEDIEGLIAKYDNRNEMSKIMEKHYL